MNRTNLIFILFFITLFSCTPEKIYWPEGGHEAKPWTRWWWMGNAVDQENIRRELQEMNEAGIGGVEITPIYGVKGEEERFIEYLSPAFTEILKYTVAEADRLGMGVDLPPGSGWRCGGPFVPEEYGLWSLKIHKFRIEECGEWQLSPTITGAASACFLDDSGEIKIIDPNNKFSTDSGGFVYVAARLKNRDMVKRASEGGQGWAIDTFDEEITQWYLDEFWKRLGIDEGLIHCFFHDSFEYTGDFTTRFTEEFKKRRGYDFGSCLHILAGDCDDPETVRRVKSDYRETLSDLVLESFIQPMTGWANRHKSLNRNQAHGSPGNILDLYAACDIPETEIFRTVEPGTVDIFVNKFASSAAHVTGQKLISSESYTWLDEHWTVSTSDMVRATNRFFLAGINHMFFHGTCYSPLDAEWPGWLFYASTQVNNRNPLWSELPALFKYIERSQSVLQSSEPDNDILIYWPYYDVAAMEGTVFNHLGVHRESVWFKDQPISGLSDRLMQAGYTFDYISDKQLADCKVTDGKIITSGDALYKALIIPETRYMPVNTLSSISNMTSEGAPVFFDKEFPHSVPGHNDHIGRQVKLDQIKSMFDEEKVCGDVILLLDQHSIPGESSLAEKGFYFMKMKSNDESWYMVVNCGTKPLDESVSLNVKSGSYIFFFPRSGEILRAGRNRNGLRIQLEPEELVFIMCTDRKYDLPEYEYFEDNDNAYEVKGLWNISFEEGGPVFPGNISTNKLLSWTIMGDDETRRFAGTAKYSTEFEWTGDENSAYLDLGEVRDCANVKLNDKDYGTLLGPAFKVRVDNLQTGKNFLQIEVTNVAANRIRDLDRRGVNWKRFYDINFISIEYKPFDASGWEVRDAGLLGPVRIIN